MKSVVKLVFAIGLTSFLVLNVIVVIREQPLNKRNLAASDVTEELLQTKDDSFNFGISKGIGAIQIEQAIAEHKLMPLDQSGKLVNHILKGTTLLTQPVVPMKRILIVTTWRSGSTFLGEIIQSAPGVFYSYEPLYYFEQRSGSKTELIQSLFRCQFSANYLQFINGLPENSQNFMLMNRRVWEACQHNRTLCYRPEFVGQLCSYFPIHLIKVVRLRVKELSSLLLADEKSSKDWKIVYLVRDPRGVMSSRANLPWCQPDPACNDPDRLCAEVEEDLEWEKRLRSQFPDRHYLLKFEDLAANVQTETEKLFRFLGMPISDPVKVFLAKHTQSNETRANPFSTIRQSNTVASEWQTKLASSEILNITNVCTPLLKTLNML